MSGKYFEEINVGDVFVTPGRTVTEADVVMYAALSGDYNQLHTDEEFAKKTRWGTRIAHGMLAITMLLGLTERLGLFDGTAIAFLGIESWKMLKPIKIGDTIRVRLRITDKKATSRPGQGVIGREYQIINQRDEVVQEGRMPVLVARKPGS